MREVDKMYSVMLADDDVPVLDFLQQTIPWEKLGLTLAGAFENGKDAYEHAEKAGAPDILVTDIGMPQMDGLELASKLMEKKRDMAVIILSCHDEFAYAQQAIRLGVTDYVLKETIEPGTVGSLLAKAVQRLEQTKGSAHSRQRGGIGDGRSVIEERLMRDMLQHPVPNPDLWRQMAEQIGFPLGASPAVPVMVSIDRLSDAKARFASADVLWFAVKNVADELFQHHGVPAASLRVTNQDMLMLISEMPPASGQMVQPPSAETMARLIRGALRDYLKLSASFLLGEKRTDPAHLRAEMQKLVEGRSLRFYLPEDTIARAADSFSAFGAAGGDPFALYADAAEQFRQIVLERQTDKIGFAVREWTERLRAERYDPDAVKEWFLKLMLDMQMKMKTMEHGPDGFSREELHQTILETNRLDQLSAVLADFLREAALKAETLSKMPRHPEIAKAMRYVELNLHRKLALDEVAEHLHLNPSYFSRLFKKETGETFVDFVTRTKMERAKLLLDTTKLTVHEVADRLGYDNKSYFIKLFKAHTGLTPGEYAGNVRD
jgi:two-component system response regulator YesN